MNIANWLRSTLVAPTHPKLFTWNRKCHIRDPPYKIHPPKEAETRGATVQLYINHQPGLKSTTILPDFGGIWELSTLAFHKTRGTWWTPPNCKTSHKPWPRRTIRFPLAESDFQFPPSASQFFKDIYNKCLFFLEEPIFPKNPCGQYFTWINII